MSSVSRAARKQKAQAPLLGEYVKIIIQAVILALIIMTWVVQAFKIPSGSMQPTLLVGDHLLVCKSYYDISIPFVDVSLITISDPERGDVIVFRFPEDRSKDFIKRVIGLPGEKVEVRGRQILINDKALDEPWAVFDDHIPDNMRGRFGPWLVPANSYFVLGDNRDHSHDSRFWFNGKGGFVPRKDIKGKALIIHWAWEDNTWSVRWGRLGTIIR